MPPKALPIDQLQPSARYRRGARDDVEARRVHADQSREWRRKIASALLDEPTRAALLAAIAVTGEVRSAAGRVGVTASAVYGRMGWDEQWREQVERVLAESCQAGEYCGTVRGYRAGGRCAKCRAAKRADRGSK